MASAERLSTLLAEYRTLDPVRDGPRLLVLLAEAATLVDPSLEPKKWASFRGMWAQLASAEQPQAALAAYLEALTVWTPADLDIWADCHSSAGLLYMRLSPLGSAGADQAIEHLTLALSAQPFLAASLGILYRHKTTGDPDHNWHERFRYFQLALSQVSPLTEAKEWSSYQHELALAYTDEPAADYSQAIEKRIACHMSVLQALRDVPGSDLWIETCLGLSEAYLFRVQGDSAANRTLARSYLEHAHAALSETTSSALRRRVYMALGRILCTPDNASPAELHQALDFFDLANQVAEPLGAPRPEPAVKANLEALRVNVYRLLLAQGEKQWLEPLVASADAACHGYGPESHLDGRRSVRQSEGEGLLQAADFARSARALEEALQLGERALAQASTPAGRLECIFKLRDSAALLSYVQLEQHDTTQALLALERGKTRFWRTGAAADPLASLNVLIPANGAALFPIFSADKGAVLIACPGASSPHFETVWLPHFGKPRVMELQRGDPSLHKLGGWLNAYAHRNSEPGDWRRAIDTLGGLLYDEVWAPVLTILKSLGITAGAELLWFSQGGSGIFPWHAAWTEQAGIRRWLLDDFALRYAPSLQCLSAAAPVSPDCSPALLVSNPGGDLPFSDLESTWIEHAFTAQPVHSLKGPSATRSAILAALPGAPFAHLATHAVFDFTDPFASSISTAGGQCLSLQELLPALAGRSPAFVALSACESGLARVTSTADEFLGFPAAFLEHGSRTVLSTLWPVDDGAAAFLVQQFYRKYLAAACSSAQALRHAQNWLRCATTSELSDCLLELIDEPAPAGPYASRVWTRLFAADPAAQPYAEPYFWAAFAISGE